MHQLSSCSSWLFCWGLYGAICLKTFFYLFVVSLCLLYYLSLASRYLSSFINATSACARHLRASRRAWRTCRRRSPCSRRVTRAAQIVCDCKNKCILRLWTSSLCFYYIEKNRTKNRTKKTEQKHRTKVDFWCLRVVARYALVLVNACVLVVVVLRSASSFAHGDCCRRAARLVSVLTRAVGVPNSGFFDAFGKHADPGVHKKNHCPNQGEYLHRSQVEL